LITDKRLQIDLDAIMCIHVQFIGLQRFLGIRPRRRWQERRIDICIDRGMYRVQATATERTHRALHSTTKIDLLRHAPKEAVHKHRRIDRDGVFVG
jgi:hypothetical protein